jgi:hypothetical protein
MNATRGRPKRHGDGSATSIRNQQWTFLSDQAFDFDLDADFSKRNSLPLGAAT